MKKKSSPYSHHVKSSFEELDDLERHDVEIDMYKIIESAISRRAFLGGSAALGVASIASGGMYVNSAFSVASRRLTFEAVAANSEDTITLPKGYSWDILMSWGDGLWSDSVAFDDATRGTGASQEKAVGDNNDGMSLFAHEGHTVLAVNNEYVNLSVFYGNRENNRPETADDIRKGKAGHGVTVCEIAQRDGRWGLVKDSSFNRRITADTPMEITGPAAGHELLKTAADPTGTKSLGTWNNCANGRTPWGTYLTCEENFNGYFSSSDEAYVVPAELKRYGIGKKDRGYGWAASDERFDISKHPNEVNRVGYVVEIDPLDPKSTPTKRTALGRFKHENAELVVNSDGQIVVYLGDDERGEFLYRFISDKKYIEGSGGRGFLSSGKLYVAKFDDNLRGEWLLLSPETTGMASQAEICIHTRQAASKVGATTMDRPEWVASNPRKAEIYCCLTNNKNRGKKLNKGGDDTPVGGPNPRAENKYGQIVRWQPDNGDHASKGFAWDLFAMAGNPDVHIDARKGSSNINSDNKFNSPDGLKFDESGILWIQTDGKYSNKGDFAGMGNNQMLAADPETGEIRRFLVGPKQCEITGIAWSTDRKTMFVGIQHPGEKGDSHFPAGGSRVPRSSIIAIKRDDGDLIG
jgi:uncharacterized protein